MKLNFRSTNYTDLPLSCQRVAPTPVTAKLVAGSGSFPGRGRVRPAGVKAGVSGEYSTA